MRDAGLGIRDSVTRDGEILDVDARGLLCPLPVLRLEKALRGCVSGTVARLSASDPAAEEDVRVFCRERGHRLIEVRHEGALLLILVEKASA